MWCWAKDGIDGVGHYRHYLRPAVDSCVSTSEPANNMWERQGPKFPNWRRSLLPIDGYLSQAGCIISPFNPWDIDSIPQALKSDCAILRCVVLCEARSWRAEEAFLPMVVNCKGRAGPDGQLRHCFHPGWIISSQLLCEAPPSRWRLRLFSCFQMPLICLPHQLTLNKGIGFITHPSPRRAIAQWTGGFGGWERVANVCWSGNKGGLGPCLATI